MINKEGNILNPDSLVELFELDTTSIGGTDILRFTSFPVEDNPIFWAGKEYKPFPFKFTGVYVTSDGTALARPTISVSNVNRTFKVALVALGSLNGAVVRRLKTFYKFTDNGTDSDITSHFPLEEYFVVKKLASDNIKLTFQLASSLDRPNLKLPKRLILRDLGFPGVSRIRSRG